MTVMSDPTVVEVHRNVKRAGRSMENILPGWITSLTAGGQPVSLITENVIPSLTAWLIVIPDASSYAAPWAAKLKAYGEDQTEFPPSNWASWYNTLNGALDAAIVAAVAALPESADGTIAERSFHATTGAETIETIADTSALATALTTLLAANDD